MDDSQPTGERSQVPVHVHDGSDSSSAPSHASTAASSRASTVACLDASAAQRSRAPAWPANVPPTQLASLPALPDLDVEGATAVRRDIPVLDFLIVGETVTSFVARGILWPPHCEYAGMRTLGLLATLPSRSRRRSRVTVAHVYQLLNRRSAKSVPAESLLATPKRPYEGSNSAPATDLEVQIRLAAQRDTIRASRGGHVPLAHLDGSSLQMSSTADSVPASL